MLQSDKSGDTVYFKIIYSSVDTTTTTTTWIFQEIVNLRTIDDIENSDITTYSTSVTGLLDFASKKSKRIFHVVLSNKRTGHRLLVLIGPISCREELVMPQTVSICLIFTELVRSLKRSNTGSRNIIVSLRIPLIIFVDSILI
ncbi:hypothetical protein TNCV_3199121 [Trichonephila clavipes]|nr:hypothetical protein TNCV_3199121 [Trichonephila clavipes]